MRLHKVALILLVVGVGCEEDAETPADGATPAVDAGRPDADGGGPNPDGGTPSSDGGGPKPDGGTPNPDSGTPNPDGGGPSADASLPTTDFEAARAIAERGRSCGVISEGYWSWEFYPGQFCSTLCLLQASCDELERTLCDEREVARLQDCFAVCDEEEEDVAQCGDGTTVPGESLCDFLPDCATGEDERHCERFQCDGGRGMSAWTRCDGWEDCEDGSDEAGCALLCGEPRAEVQE